MAKRKVKNSVDNLAAAQPRLLKTRRRERPGEQTKTADVEANLQETAADAFPLKETTLTSAVAQQQTEHHSLVTEEEPGDREADVSANTEMATMTEVGPPTTFNISSIDSQPEVLMAPMDNQNGDLEEVIAVAETSGSDPHPGIDPLLVIQVPPTVALQEKPLTAFEDQPGGRKSSHCDMKKNRETDQYHSTSDSTAEVEEVTLLTQVIQPAKKKPRIEMYDQAEEDRSHLLQAETETSVALGPSSEFIHTGGDAEQTEAEEQRVLHVNHRNDGIQAEVHGAVITSDGLSASLQEHSCEDKDGVVDGPQVSGHTRSDPPAGQENQEQQQPDRDPVDNVSEEPLQQMEGAVDVDQGPANGLISISLKNQAAEKSDITKATPLLANSDTNPKAENSNHSVCDAAKGSSSAETSSEGCALSPAVSSFGSEKKGTLGFDDNQGRIKASTGPFGPAYLDYVSDSQLSTIPLTEEEIVKGEKDLGSSNCLDGTDLICGLIKELSWLNRKVMATHRELENMRRSTRSLRSSTR